MSSAQVVLVAKLKADIYKMYSRLSEKYVVCVVQVEVFPVNTSRVDSCK